MRVISRMLMPSRWARRISPYWNTVSILCLRFQDCPGDGPYWNGSGWGGSRLLADFRVGGGSLLRADYQLPRQEQTWLRTLRRPGHLGAQPTGVGQAVVGSRRCQLPGGQVQTQKASRLRRRQDATSDGCHKKRTAERTEYHPKAITTHRRSQSAQRPTKPSAETGKSLAYKPVPILKNRLFPTDTSLAKGPSPPGPGRVAGGADLWHSLGGSSNNRAVTKRPFVCGYAHGPCPQRRRGNAL